MRKQLFTQFIGESIIITLLALAVAFLLSRLALPAFESITGKSFAAKLLYSTPFVSAAVVTVLVIAFVAGAYPALAITSFKAGERTQRGISKHRAEAYGCGRAWLYSSFAFPSCSSWAPWS